LAWVKHTSLLYKSVKKTKKVFATLGSGLLEWNLIGICGDRSNKTYSAKLKLTKVSLIFNFF